ncbi:DNA adenine methylase [Novosphingopyxis iocasae]|uniref:DNA adenine methylase n=1 Tax=Novosphingopyxis iocasae TaxID=2762729 RepID=UPI0016512DBC|nr:DNA adenine methylase [Novosphingopyxis iocasae]
MAIEYIGNKAQLVDRMWECMRGHLREKPKGFADLFCGTASVSQFMRARGFRVTANDSLLLCSTFAEAALLTEIPPSFVGLAQAGVLVAPPKCRYAELLRILNGLSPVEGFMFRTYSPASLRHGANEARMYFTEENSGRLDAMRHQIAQWRPDITTAEHALLLVDLVKAANRVSNIAGTYGCYLKDWKTRALQSVVVTESRLSFSGPRGEVFRQDALDLVQKVEAEVIYADPPYTKRQYAAYYHLLETLVAGDEPKVTGSTGLRPWEHAASDFCYRRKAPGALRDLVLNLKEGSDFFLSYNEDGQIHHDEIVKILSERGKVTVNEFALRRYKSSNLPHKGRQVAERLYHVKASA